MTAEITLDPDQPFEAVLIEMVKLNRAKRADYAGDEEGDSPHQNFYDTAYQCNQTPGQSCEQLVATKQTRLRVLTRPGNKKPKNEPIRDTIRDCAVYSAIALALYDEGSYEPDWQTRDA